MYVSNKVSMPDNNTTKYEEKSNIYKKNSMGKKGAKQKHTKFYDHTQLPKSYWLAS